MIHNLLKEFDLGYCSRFKDTVMGYFDGQFRYMTEFIEKVPIYGNKKYMHTLSEWIISRGGATFFFKKKLGLTCLRMNSKYCNTTSKKVLTEDQK